MVILAIKRGLRLDFGLTWIEIGIGETPRFFVWGQSPLEKGAYVVLER